MRICAYTTRRLQWTVIDCERNLQQRPRTLYKKNVGAHLTSPTRTLKSGVHLFAALRTLENVLFESLNAGHRILPLYRVSPCLPLLFCLTLFWSIPFFFFWKKIELIVRVSLHAGGLHVSRPLHWDLNFDFECPWAVRCTWTKWHWKPVHSPYQHPSASCLQKKKNQKTGLSVLVMNSQLLFADSLTSTLLDWMGYATGLSVLARPHSHIQLMLESVLSLHFPAVMMLEVMYQTSLTSKRSSITPGPR